MQSTNRTFWITLGSGLLLLAPAFAQRVDNYRAQIRGGGGDRGKCTIEVDVDGVAEIEIRGDQGVMRTLSGNPSAWRRMECNQPLPPNPYDFRFSGVDGRGRQTLLRDPANNRGVAVVRIEDENPVVRRGIDRAIDLRAGFCQRDLRPEIRDDLFESREMRGQRLDRFRVDVAERDD